MNDQRQAISEAYLADEDELLGRLIPKAKMTPAEEAATAALARDSHRQGPRAPAARQRRRCLHAGICALER